jgi:hypothetical protein
MMIVFATFSQKNVLAGKNVHSFYLPSVLKQSSDVQPREISFAVKYPGDIKVDASWEPGERELTITIYDQEGKSLVSKKDMSPVHLVYTYTQEHFNKARFFGNSFVVGISQSPFKTINGSVKIITPGKRIIKEDDSINTRGPYGTFIEKEKEEEPEN